MNLLNVVFLLYSCYHCKQISIDRVCFKTNSSLPNLINNRIHDLRFEPCDILLNTRQSVTVQILLNHCYVVLCSIIVQTVKKLPKVFLNSNAVSSLSFIDMLVDSSAPPPLQLPSSRVSLHFKGKVQDVHFKNQQLVVFLLYGCIFWQLSWCFDIRLD